MTQTPTFEDAETEALFCRLVAAHATAFDPATPPAERVIASGVVLGIAADLYLDPPQKP